jgi:hypothetical protein
MRRVIGVTKNVVDKTRGIPRRWAVLLSLIVIVGAGLLFVRTVLAVHDAGKFQLDGDAASGTFTVPTVPPPLPPDDWDKVCYEVAVKPVAQGGLGLSAAAATTKCGIGSPTTGATATSWVEEPNPASSIFTGGGSKDPIDISSWLWKDDQNNPPDKDNLVHAYAVRYSLPNSATCPSGDPLLNCELIYFGSDRFDNSGDATQGFWFLQNKVGLTEIKSQGGLAFSGVHKLGDLLIISDFSNGGGTSTISIYKWDPACTAANKPDPDCKDSNLRLLADLTGPEAHCLTAGAADQGCGLVNPSTITMPWSFTDKSGTPNNQALNGEFFEAGINLSLLDLGGECFATVVSETRSSTSTGAVLKDFVLGSFAVCAPGMTTTASATVASPVTPGTAVHDTATITVTGATSPPDPTGTVTFFLCGPIATGACTTGGTNIGTGALVGGANTTDGIATATSPDVNTAASVTGVLAAGRYCFRAEWPGDSNYGPASHTNDTTECFAVKDTSAITTAQEWLPNDSAHVTTGSGTAASGTVGFTLYQGANCTGTVIASFLNRPVDAAGNASTNNTSTYIVTTPGAVISWRAVFTPSDPNAVGGSTSHCETSTVTINNDIGS